MSYTEMYVVTPESDGKFVCSAHFQNSYGSAPFVWERLLYRYRELIVPGKQFYGEPGCEAYARDLLLSIDCWPMVWDFEKEHGEKMQPWERNVLYSTYDGALLPREGFLVMADSLQRFYDQYYVNEVRNRVCSIDAQASVLRRVHEEGALYAAWYQTSTSEWFGEIRYDEETEEEIPYNVNTRTDHWLIEVLPIEPEVAEGAKP